jgi:hypothetical protein
MKKEQPLKFVCVEDEWVKVFEATEAAEVVNVYLCWK